MDSGLWNVFVVLNVFRQSTILVDFENVSVTCIVVEWICVDVIWRLLRCQQEYGSCVGIRSLSGGCNSMRKDSNGNAKGNTYNLLR
jgi:hypothetical protein